MVAGHRVPRILRSLPMLRNGHGGGAIPGHGVLGRIHQEMAAMRIGSMCPAEIAVQIGEATLGIGGTLARWLRGVRDKGIVGDNLSKMMRDYLNVMALAWILMIFPEVIRLLGEWLPSMTRRRRMRRRKTPEKSPALTPLFSVRNRGRTTRTGREP